MSYAKRLMPCFALLLLAGCDCGGDSDPGDGGGLDGAGLDGAGLDGAGTDGAGLDAASCTGAGGACAAGTECCSGTCEGDVCVGGCLADGETCATGAECCSDNCASGTCAPPVTMCTRVGNPCMDGASCCSGNCVDSGGAACAGGGSCVCAPRVGCTAAGGTCMNNRQCCNGFCDSGSCAELSACRTAGEPCSTEGLSGSCCSTVCLNTDGTEPRCQFLGGCRVQDELCRSDSECCSGACEVTAMTSDGREIRRCGNVESCLPAGEVCGDGGASSNCCPNGGGDTGCEPTGTGFRRCFGGTPGCVIPSGPCTTTADCCVDVDDMGDPLFDVMCLPDRSGTNACCIPDGSECAFGDMCCSGICAPDPSDGVLRCGAMCIADGAACTVDADCCGCGCVSDGMGGQICTSDAGLCGPCTGPSLGELCDPMGEACCNGPTVICNTSTEFPTCILAP